MAGFASEPTNSDSSTKSYLLCNGQAVSRSTYSALFSAVSTTYGTGDGSSTFNLPDLQGRAPIGSGSGSGLSSRSVGATGGFFSKSKMTKQKPKTKKMKRGGLASKK